MDPVGQVRRTLGAALFSRVAGAEGPARRDRIHTAPGPRRFTSDDPIAVVHADASMFVGGIRALLLQALHPSAMAAVDQHSGFRGDPWGRLQRTSTFLAETTFGTTDDADRAIAVVRSVHARISGTTPAGIPYRADDPELLRWVHVAEIDSFLRAHDRYGDRPLTGHDRDRYVAQTAVIARALGAGDVPEDARGLDAALAEFGPSLGGTEEARRTARFLLVHPPVPLALRLPYGVLAAAAVELLPRWARRALRLPPRLPIAEAATVRAAGAAATRTIRWAMNPAPASAAPTEV